MLTIAKVAPPTKEKMREKRRELFLKAATNPNCFTAWFPVVEELGIRTPKSDWFPITPDMQISILSGDKERTRNALKPAGNRIRSFSEIHDGKAFLKNSLYSSKDQWSETCFYDGTKKSAEDHISAIYYDWEIVSQSETVARFIVMREVVETTALFHAFNNMPIAQEFRFFADKGSLYGYQPYWPKKAIENPSSDDWASLLEEAAKPSSDLFDEMKAMAEKVTKALDGDYSVDFLIDREGRPWLIDMAISDDSFFCDEEYKRIKESIER